MTQAAATLISSNINDGGGVETVLATSNVPVVSQPNPARPLKNPVVRISGAIWIQTPGAGIASATIRCRQTDVNGAQVGPTQIIAINPGVSTLIPLYFLDTTGVSEKSGGLNYVITISTSTATQSTGVYVQAVAEVLDPT